MRYISFSEDFEKLPLDWDGTDARLISMKTCDINQIPRDVILKDTKIRGQNKYFEIDFRDAICLFFFHEATETPFMTFRVFNTYKFAHYRKYLYHNFKMKKVKK